MKNNTNMSGKEEKKPAQATTTPQPAVAKVEREGTPAQREGTPAQREGTPARSSSRPPRPPPTWLSSIKILDVIRYVVFLVMDLIGGRASLGRDSSDYVKRLLSLVWPVFSAPTGSPDGVGRFEIFSLMVLAIVRTYIMDVSAELMKKLNAAVYRRDSHLFKVVGKTGVMIAIAAAFVNSLVSLCRERLGILWKQKLTAEAHRRYFSNMNYYYVGTTKKPRAIPNADDIMTQVGSTSTRLVTLIALLCKSLPPIFWFTYKMYSRHGVFQAMLPHLYLLLAYEVAQRLFPKNIGLLWRGKAASQGSYNKAIARIQQNAEAISALNGSEKEKAILAKSYSKVTGTTLDLHKGNSKHELVFKVAYVYGCKSWIQSFVLYPILQAAGNASDNVGALVGFKNSVEIMTEMLIGNGDILTLHATAAHMRPICRGLCDLFDTLSTLTAQHSSQQSTNFHNDPEKIGFEGVNVYTPAGQLLVRDLTFDVTKGRSLLLTGHNGAGKSSIFRCLGGLWPLREGVVTKPNSTPIDGHELASDAVFYLPQRPYNVLGSLVDQLTYPKKDEGHFGELDKSVRGIEREKHILDLLRLVDLLHLVDDAGKWETEVVNWEERLSLGEQQRLAMARLFYHSPTFAILDECTSAVSQAMERTLYAECIARDITYITICHRPALKQYHSQNLHLLGEGSDGGWELHKLDEPVVPTQQDSLVKDVSSSGPENVAAQVPLKKRNFFSKLSMLLKIVMPGTRRKTVLLLAFIMIRVYMMQMSALLTGKLMRAALDGDRRVFFKYAALSGAQDLATAFFESTLGYLQNRMSVDWHDNLAKHAQDLYMSRNNFYKTKYVDGRITDVDARLSQEIFDLSEHLSAVLTKSIQPLASAAFVGYRLKSILTELYSANGNGNGSEVMKGLYFYIVAVSAIVKYCMPDHETLVQLEKTLEARFKFIHNRLRSHSESIAFFGGGKREKAIADASLTSLVDQQLATRKTESRFKVISLSLLKNYEDPSCIISTSHVMNLYFQLQIALSSGRGTKPETLHAVSESISQSLESFSKLAGLYEHFSKLGGSSTRVCQAFDVLSQDSGSTDTKVKDAKEISFRNVDIVTPKGVSLAKQVSLNVAPQQSLLVTGPNGVGKTSFFRVLAGLWGAGAKADISKPVGNISLVPQKLYMCSGTLADQVVYPSHYSKADESASERIVSCLDAVGIKRLVTRERKVRVHLGRDVISKLLKLKSELEQSCKVQVQVDGQDDIIIRGGSDGCAKAVHSITEHAGKKAEVISNESAGLEKVEQWEQVLSLGEQQRLAIARILYHKPLFAVLDECTDAVSMDVERQLYEKIHAGNTTCITISKRLALPEFHTQQLHLGMYNPPYPPI